jgi:hypothetical protein
MLCRPHLGQPPKVALLSPPPLGQNEGLLLGHLPYVNFEGFPTLNARVSSSDGVGSKELGHTVDKVVNKRGVI